MNGLKLQANTSSRRTSRRPSPAGSAAMLVAASLLATAVAACGTDSKTSDSSTTATSATSASSSAASTSAAAPTPDAAGIVAESAKTTQTLRTIHLNLKATNLPTLQVETVDADVSSVEQGNGQAVGNAAFRLTPDQPYTPTDFLVTQQKFYTKGADGKWEDKGESKRIYDPAIVLDREKGLANLIKNVKDPKDAGKDTIDGVAVVKVTGMIDAAVVDPIVPTLGTPPGQLPITLWIADVPPPPAGPTTSLPSEAPSPGQGPNLVRFNVVKEQGNVDVTFSKWAQPVTIPSPTG